MDSLITFKESVLDALRSECSDATLRSRIGCAREVLANVGYNPCVMPNSHDRNLVCPECVDINKIQDDAVQALIEAAVAHFIAKEARCKCAVCGVVSAHLVELRGMI